MNCCYMERTENYVVNGSEQALQTQTSFPLQELKEISRISDSQLRKYPDLLTLTEEQANAICDTLLMLSVLFYELYSQTKSK